MEGMNNMKWYNIELPQNESINLRLFLRDNGIKFETSACYNLVHFEVYASQNQVTMINSFLNTLFV